MLSVARKLRNSLQLVMERLFKVVVWLGFKEPKVEVEAEAEAWVRFKFKVRARVRARARAK